MARSAFSGIDRTDAAIALLGFSSGLPAALTADLLRLWLSDEKVPLASIGWIGLVILPYAFKPLWAPLLDRYVPPLLGRRRGWLLISQLLLAFSVLLLSHARPAASLRVIALAATAVAFFSATQDIVIDAWRTEILPPKRRGIGAAIYVAAWRMGLIVGSAAALYAHRVLNIAWPDLYAALAVCIGVGILGTFVAIEPEVVASPKTLMDAVWLPLLEMLRRPGAVPVLAFVLIFKLPEYLVSSMSVLFLKQIQISEQDIAVYAQGTGIAITIAGAFAGGFIVKLVGVWRSLWIFGVLHSVSGLAYAALAISRHHFPMMVAATSIESACIGLTTAGFIAWMMGQCDSRFTAFQFALLSGLMLLGKSLANPLAGHVSSAMAWPWFFVFTAITGLPGLLLIPGLPRRDLSGSLKD